MRWAGKDTFDRAAGGGNWNIWGTLSMENALNLELEDGAQVLVLSPGTPPLLSSLTCKIKLAMSLISRSYLRDFLLRCAGRGVSNVRIPPSSLRRDSSITDPPSTPGETESRSKTTLPGSQAGLRHPLPQL